MSTEELKAALIEAQRAHGATGTVLKDAQIAYQNALMAEWKYQPGTILEKNGKQYIVNYLSYRYDVQTHISWKLKSGEWGKQTKELWEIDLRHYSIVTESKP